MKAGIIIIHLRPLKRLHNKNVCSYHRLCCRCW